MYTEDKEGKKLFWMEEDEGGRIDGRECGDDTQRRRTEYGVRNRKQTVVEQQKQQEKH